MIPIVNLAAMLGNRDKRQYTLLFGASAPEKLAGRFKLTWNTVPKQAFGDFFKKDVVHDVFHDVEDTIKNYVTKSYEDYIRPQIEELGCCPTQKWIFL